MNNPMLIVVVCISDDVGLSIPGMGGMDTSFLKPPPTEASPATHGTRDAGADTSRC
jgi:hypothetical protein